MFYPNLSPQKLLDKTNFSCHVSHVIYNGTACTDDNAVSYLYTLNNYRTCAYEGVISDSHIAAQLCADRNVCKVTYPAFMFNYRSGIDYSGIAYDCISIHYGILSDENALSQ